MSPLELVAFLAAVLLVYYLVPRAWQSAVLLCASVFYCLTVSFSCLLSVISVCLAAFFSARHIERSREQGERRRVLILGLVAVLFSFVLSRAMALFGGALSAISGGIGLAFYSLSAAGYLIDLYRGKIKSEKSFFYLLLFIGFFPCIRLGPISRYKDLSPQLKATHAPTWENITSGFLRILWGYFKKLVVADTALVALKNMVAETQKHSGGYAFFLIILYSLIIYADFTGGIDVALGAGKTLGITLPENFDRPFSSISVREYWRRWHITLGAFFSDYVFYPLSISKPMQGLSRRLRRSRSRRISKRLPIYIALTATWLLTGAWHSLSANYICWGIANAAVIITAQEISSARTRPYKVRTAHALAAARTFFIIGAIRLFDLWSNPVTALRTVASIFFDPDGWVSLFGGGIFTLGLSAPEWVVIICGVALIFAVSRICDTRGDKMREPFRKRPLAVTACAAILAALIAIFGSYGVGFEEASFIYAQF